MGKYWIANNPKAEITEAQAIALKNLSTSDLTEIEQIISDVDELTALATALPVAAEVDVTVTQSSNAVTANNAVTIADGSSPSNDEIYELAIETVTKLNSLLAKLRTAGIITA
jgi:hypothetical protein